MLRQYWVYVFRFIKQGLGMLCKWNIGGDCRTLSCAKGPTRFVQSHRENVTPLDVYDRGIWMLQY